MLVESGSAGEKLSDYLIHAGGMVLCKKLTFRDQTDVARGILNKSLRYEMNFIMGLWEEGRGEVVAQKTLT